MKNILKKMVAVAMMSLTLLAPVMNGAEAASHSKPGGQGGQPPRHEQRMDYGGHQPMGGYRHDYEQMGNPGSRQPMHQAPRQQGWEHGESHHDRTAAVIGGILLGVILGAAMNAADSNGN